MVAFRGIAEGVENTNYSLQHHRRRLHPDAVREAGGPGRTALVPRADGASGRGAASSARCRCTGATARRCGMLCGRHAAITTFLPGVWPRRVRLEHCGPVGAALAALHLAGAGLCADAAQRAGPGRLARRCWSAARRRAPTRCSRGWRRNCEAALARILAGLAGRAAGRAHPRRPVPRQRVLPGRAAVRADRLLFRRHRHPGLRRRGVPERLVLRAGFLVQRDQGAGDAAGVRGDRVRCRRRSARRCRCCARARRCASC